MNNETIRERYREYFKGGVRTGEDDSVLSFIEAECEKSYDFAQEEFKVAMNIYPNATAKEILEIVVHPIN